jgi:hypothetical protein
MKEFNIKRKNKIIRIIKYWSFKHENFNFPPQLVSVNVLSIFNDNIKRKNIHHKHR